MATIFIDGFDHYGIGAGSGGGPAYNALLSGVYAYVPNISSAGIGAPSYGARTGSSAAFNIDDPTGFRLVLPASYSDEFFVSLGFSMSNLPSIGPGRNTICSFCNGSNVQMAALAIETTGVLSLYGASTGTLLGATNGPVIAAGTWYQLTMSYNAGGSFDCYVNGTLVLNNVSGYGSTAIAQLAFLGGPDTVGSFPTMWMDDLVIMDTTGSFNNSLPSELQVATLLPDNDASPQGWTPNPRQLFGTGVLDTTNSTSFENTSAACATLAMEPALQLGSGDFSLEGWFRFQEKPTGSNLAHLAGAWDTGASRLSYQLALCGPGLNNGNLIFRITTDGTTGTLINVINWPFFPNLDTWYHIAISRASGETMLFVNGVQQGPAVADTNTYYAATTRVWGIGGENAQGDGTSWFQGWIEELRLTVGYARYTANFAPPAAEFPIGGSDSYWTNVQLLANFDGGNINDLSQNAWPLTVNWGAAADVPNDGMFAWECIAKPDGPLDDTFIAAPELQATSIFTQTVQFTDGDTVTVATKDGTNAAVYRAKSTMAAAYDFQLDTRGLQYSLANLAAAINAGPGLGTAYYAGTHVNNDVSATQLPLEQVQVTADIAGMGGNSLATSTTASAGSWPGAYLTGGTSIPNPSAFTFSRPPLNTTLVAAVAIVTRQYKTDAGTCQTQASVAGPLGSYAAGALYLPSTNPSYHQDCFDENPDTGGAWTPTAVVGMTAKINRTE